MFAQVYKTGHVQSNIFRQQPISMPQCKYISELIWRNFLWNIICTPLLSWCFVNVSVGVWWPLFQHIFGHAIRIHTGMGQNWILQKIVMRIAEKWTIFEAPRVSILIHSHSPAPRLHLAVSKLCDLVVSMASHLAQTFNGAILPANTGIQKKKLQTRQCNSPLL